MKIQSLIDSRLVFLDLEAKTADQALMKLADRIVGEAELPRSDVTNGLIDREKLGSTSVGGGFAIPHCKLPGLKNLVVALGGFSSPIPFGDAADTAVGFFFVVLSPPDQPALHLQVLSQIARILKDREVRTQLLEATSVDEVVSVVRAAAEREGL